MVDPTFPYVIAVEVVTNAIPYSVVSVQNFSTGDKAKFALDAGSRGAFDCNNFENGWAVGQIVHFNLGGDSRGSGSHTIIPNSELGLVNLQITGTTDASTQTITM